MPCRACARTTLICGHCSDDKVLTNELACLGDGYVTDHNSVQYGGASDASGFFNRLVRKPYLSQFLVAPHIYCGEVTGQTYGTSGKTLYDRLTLTFGYLTLQGA